MEPNASPLLDWVLQKQPGTPKSRAKQWILAGRVSVNGVVIRKPHQLLADPGDALELGARLCRSIGLTNTPAELFAWPQALRRATTTISTRKLSPRIVAFCL